MHTPSPSEFLLDSGISFIIPVHEETIYLEDTLKSILLQESLTKLQIIIVLNNFDENLDHFKNLHQDILIVKENRQGPSYARNCGLSHARYDFVAFLDCDISLKSNWALTNMELLLKYPQMACVQAKIFPRFKAKSFLEIYRSTTVRMITKGTFNYLNNPNVMPSLNSAAILCRKEFLFNVGCFSTELKKLEDTDLTYKFLKEGYILGVNLRSSASVFNNHRSLFKYFKRSFLLGRYGHHLQSKWELPSNKLVSLNLSGKDWRIRLVSKLNFLAHSAGLKLENALRFREVRSPQKIVDVDREPLNPFKTTCDGIEYVLRPNIRMLVFTHKIHFIDFRTNNVILMKQTDLSMVPGEVIKFAFKPMSGK